MGAPNMLHRVKEGVRMKRSLLLGLFVASWTGGVAFAEPPCGLKGEVPDRITECATSLNGWNLVTRTESGDEVWQNPTGILWGKRFDRPMTLGDAESACKKFGSSAASGKNDKVKWSLPRPALFANLGDDYRKWPVFPELEGVQFWVMQEGACKDGLWFLDGSKGTVTCDTYLAANQTLSVICVGS
jgi:hypothetical protein